jgi:hypothetical protein
VPHSVGLLRARHHRPRNCRAAKRGYEFCSTTTGRLNANVEPWPTCDSTQIRPPCISMMRFDIASPRPVPPFFLVMALSAC